MSDFCFVLHLLPGKGFFGADTGSNEVVFVSGWSEALPSLSHHDPAWSLQA